MDKNLAQTMTLVARAKLGDKAAFDLLLSRYAERILRIVRFRLDRDLRARMDSMDVFQDVMLRVVRSIAGFEPENEASFLNWVATLVRNEVRDKADHTRAAKRDLGRESDRHEKNAGERSLLAAFPAPSVEAPGRIVDLIEDVCRLEEAMDRLSDVHREIVIMREYEGFTYGEIGLKLGLSEDAVRMQYGRAMDKLTDWLAG